MLCYIVGASDFSLRAPPPPDCCLIAADGGYAALTARGYTPDLVVGDFDSLPYVPDHPNILRHPTEKDDTDLFLAVQEGLMRGYDTFILNGALGGRLDHTLGSLQTLAYLAHHNARAVLVGDDCNVTAIANGEARFTAHAAGFASVFAYGGPACVTMAGLKYSASDLVMAPDVPRGVSNEFLGVPARVRVQDGAILITWTGDLYNTLEGFLL